MPDEFFIREEENEEAKGPFTLDQLQSLAGASKVTEDTLVYDEARELWVKIRAWAELKALIYPEKKKLALKKAEAPAPVGPDKSDLDKHGEELPEVAVEDMLAAAEGQTEDTEHLKHRENLRNKAAALSVPGLGVIMALCAFSLIYPRFPLVLQAVEEQTYLQMADPYLIIGFLDLIWSVFLFLAVSEIFPILRLRAALGLGFWGFVFWNGGDPLLMASVMAGHAAIFVCTMTLNFYLMLAGLIVGIGGMFVLAYLALSGLLLPFI